MKKIFMITAAVLTLGGNALCDEDTDSFDDPIINFWPIFTRDQENIFVAWPMADHELAEPGKTTNPQLPVQNAVKPKDSVTDEESDPHCILLFPIYNQVWDKNSNSIVSFPLFWYNDDREESFFNLTGPIYHYYQHKKAQTAYNAFVWPVAEYRFNKNGEIDGWHFWPMVSWDNAWPSLLNVNPGKTDFLGPLVFQYSAKDNNHQTNILLLYSQSRKVTDSKYLPAEKSRNPINGKEIMPYKTRTASQTIIFPLWYGFSEELAVWKPEADKEKINQVTKALATLTPRCAFGIENCKARWHKAHPAPEKELKEANDILIKLLPELQIIPVYDKDKKIDTAATRRTIAEKYTVIRPFTGFSLPLLFNYRAMQPEYKWDVMFFLTGGHQSEKSSSFNIMEYLYRHERDGKVESQFIFPFITTRTAPDRSRFAFLWRLYERENNNGKISGHIFFIPYGKEKKAAND